MEDLGTCKKCGVNKTVLRTLKGAPYIGCAACKGSPAAAAPELKKAAPASPPAHAKTTSTNVPPRRGSTFFARAFGG